ncbi:MAG: NUDIX hydrolase [Proteobacteria bacterium]|nr:NUDIX hydrolase [Pseudomonadota bacterium]
MTDTLIETITRNYIKGTHKASRPVDASSMVLINWRGTEPRILMGKRNPAAKFMPGFFVFPGGRIEREDGDAPHAGSLSEADMARLARFVSRPTERRLRGIALGAIRETFEETGFRLAVPASDAPAPMTDPSWVEFLSNGTVPTLDGVLYFARAITPPGRSRRFDTRFFVVDISGFDDLSTVRPTPDSELVELRWVTLDEAMKVEAAEITQIILGELKAFIQAGCAPEAVRPFFRAWHGKFQRISL